MLGELMHWMVADAEHELPPEPSAGVVRRLLADLARREQLGRLVAAGNPVPAVRPARTPREALLAFPGVGPGNAATLLSHFGSARRVVAAREAELTAAIGPRRGARLDDLFNTAAVQ